MSALRFDPKDVAEACVLSFDFDADLDSGETLVGAVLISIEATRGLDADPAALLVGASGFAADARSILQAVAGGIAGERYRIKVVSATSNPLKRLALAGVLPVTNH